MVWPWCSLACVISVIEMSAPTLTAFAAPRGGCAALGAARRATRASTLTAFAQGRLCTAVPFDRRGASATQPRLHPHRGGCARPTVGFAQPTGYAGDEQCSPKPPLHPWGGPAGDACFHAHCVRTGTALHSRPVQLARRMRHATPASPPPRGLRSSHGRFCTADRLRRAASSARRNPRYTLGAARRATRWTTEDRQARISGRSLAYALNKDAT